MAEDAIPQENLAGVLKRQKEKELIIPEWKGHIEAGGTKTWVEVHGQGFSVERGSDGKDKIKIDESVIPVLIVVGGADYYRFWPLDKTLVAELGVPVIGFDPPGQTGRSENLKDPEGKPRRHTMEEYARFQNELVTTLLGEGRKVNILAMSMGGVPTMMFAGAHPELINRLVLVGTFLKIKDRPLIERIQNLWKRGRGEKETLEQSLKELFDSLQLSPVEAAEAKKRFLNPRWLHSHLVTVVESFVDLLFSADATSLAEKISAPTLLIAGTKDRLAPVSEAQKVQRAIPEAELVTVSTEHSHVLGSSRTFNPISVSAIVEHFTSN